ncbi:hypothetical protein [Streptosporangium sp. NPDC051022]
MADVLPPREPGNGEEWLLIAQALVVLLDLLRSLGGGGGLR